MGYLLKEALKTLCGVNQWSYAVFWKIGCQNPKLLIWEECYYGPITYSSLPHISGIENPDVFDEWEACWVSSEARNSLLGVQAGERVRPLVNKMMMNSHVNVVGEGLVGRAAFTGNYEWIVSQNYTRESHPPEVLNELRQQVSAGMQTVAVIPVLPHGVLQFGSSLAIMENMGFVNDVKTLVQQLGCVPGALFSDSYATKEPVPKIGASIGLRKSASMDSSGKSMVTDLSHLTSYINDNYNQQDNSPASRGVGETSNFIIRPIQDNLQSTGPTFQSRQSSFKTNGHGHAEVIPVMKPKSQLENGVAAAEIIPSNPEAWLNQETSFHILGSRMNQQPSSGPLATNYGSLRFLEQQMLVDAVGGDHVNNRLNESNIYSSHRITNGGLVTSSHKGSSSVISHEASDLHNGLGGHVSVTSIPSSLPTAHRLANTNVSSVCASGFQNVAQYKTEVSNSGFAENLTTSRLLSDSSDDKHQFMDKKCTQVNLDEGKVEMENDIFHAISIPFPQSDEHISLTGHIPGYGHDGQKHDYGYQSMGLNNAQFEDTYVQAQSGDELFDILGVNFKNKLFYESFLNNGPGTNSQNMDKSNYASNKLQNVCSGLQLVNEGNSDSAIFSVTGTDHLLDAVVSKVQSATKQSSDDNVSCRTTLTKLSSSSAPLASPSTGQANASNQMQEELFGLSKSLTKAGALGSCSFKSGSCKEDVGSYSQTNSFFGSQISSWVEQGHDMKSSTSASTAYSKKTDEISKSNRKRLKPGENPRPRPKDRQMIQDRVKELREIVPNGSKCSIDALLERTIKHMLFLQSVTKHADKLKQTGESKIISEEGGLLLKDNFEGGATWAYEVGSQSMVCPIIVEDLNPPRQMLVEMLCEERGLFLEIADIIRGMGLTILKGVMETRNDKIWARFAVEANRDVTRMEIFISLVRLLEQTVKNSSAPVNCIGNDNVSSSQPFHQAASIPATGMPCGFQ